MKFNARTSTNADNDSMSRKSIIYAGEDVYQTGVRNDGVEYQYHGEIRTGLLHAVVEGRPILVLLTKLALVRRLCEAEAHSNNTLAVSKHGNRRFNIIFQDQVLEMM